MLKSKIALFSITAILTLALANTTLFAQTDIQQNASVPENEVTIKYVPTLPGQSAIHSSEAQYINSLSPERKEMVNALIKANMSGKSEEFINSSEGIELKEEFKNDPSFAKNVVSHADSSNPEYLKSAKDLLGEPLSLGQTVKYVFPDGSAVIRSFEVKPIDKTSSPLSGGLLSKVSAYTYGGTLTSLGNYEYEFIWTVKSSKA